MTTKIDFTFISMKHGKIGVLAPGSRIKDEPKYYTTEEDAIRAVCSCDGNKGKHKIHMRFCETVYAGAHKRHTFVPENFLKECNERMKKPKPAREVA